MYLCLLATYKARDRDVLTVGLDGGDKQACEAEDGTGFHFCKGRSARVAC